MKKRILLTLLSLVCTFACALGLAACSGTTTPDKLLDTQTHEHVWASAWSMSETSHWHACEVSGCSEKNGNVAHDFANGNCICGKQKSVETHTTHSWSATYTADGERHYQTCNGCSDKKYDSHSYNSIGYCICGAAQPSGDTTHTHNWSQSWVQSATHHWHICTANGCAVTDNAQKDGYAAHIPGAAATETTAQTCTICEYVIVAPLGHTHSTTLVPAQSATCTENGNIAYYTCSCDKWFSNEAATDAITDKSSVTINATGHSFANTWSHNDTQHWYAATCAHNGEKSSIGNHDFQNRVCSVCTYSVGLISFKTLQVNADDSVYGKVSNATTTFSFLKEVTPNDGATYTVSTDMSGKSPIPTGTVLLNEGDNTFYVLAECGNEKTLFIVTIRRRLIYTVSFNTNGGSTVSAQQIEEDSEATAPTTTKLGYTLTSWQVGSANILFPYVITKNVTIAAMWQVRDEMSNFEFTSTSTTCSITGIKDKTISEIIIPEYVTSIRYDAFYGCNSLTSITVDDNNHYYSSQDGILYNKAKTQFVYVPKAITGSVTIPNTITSSGSSAFSGCNSLASITVDDNNPNYSSQDGILYNKAKTQFVHIPTAITGSVTIPNTITNIERGTFSGYSSLTSITIPNSVTSIGYEAFSGCNSLTSITLPFVGASKNGTSNTHFGYIFGAAYAYNSNSTYSQNSNMVPAPLKTVIITGGTSIDRQAFSGCSGLTSITISDSVTLLGSRNLSFTTLNIR